MIEIYALTALVAASAAGALWALVTGGPEPRSYRHERQPEHSRGLQDGPTTRLGPPPPAEWSQIPPLPPLPDDPAIRLPTLD